MKGAPYAGYPSAVGNLITKRMCCTWRDRGVITNLLDCKQHARLRTIAS